MKTLQTRLRELEAQERRQLRRKLQDLLTKLDALAQLDDVAFVVTYDDEDSRQGRANT